MKEEIKEVERLMKQCSVPEIWESDIEDITDIDFLKKCRGEFHESIYVLKVNHDVFHRRIQELKIKEYG